jgi:DNA repair protein RadA/Sms
VVGWDSGRLAMLLAVLESRCGLNFSSCEVYLNIAGGYRLSDPAADLAVAAALVSALADRPLPDKAAWFGEVSLAGEIRPVAHGNLRLREAAKLGFVKGYGPPGGQAGSTKLDYRGLTQLANLVDQVIGTA